MKKLIFLTAIILTAFCSKAQDKTGIKGFKIGAGLSLAIPLNNLSSNSVGAGIDILAQYGITHNIAVTADAGFTVLFAKDNNPSTGIIPIRIGLRYFPISQIYLGAKAGLGVYTLGIVSNNYTAYSFGAGYMLSAKLDIGISYDGYVNSNTSFGYMAIRLGYNFGK